MPVKPYGIIYLAVNKINGKKYIGQTHGLLKTRTKRHFYRSNNGSTQVFSNAIRKYGKSAFDWSIIDTALSQEELDEKEIYWIDTHRSFVDWEDSNGYNMTLGGESTVLSEKARLKISEYAKSRIGRNSPRARAIVQMTLSGEFIAEYSTVVELEEKNGWKRSTINGCLKGRRKSAYGFRWFYKVDYEKHLNNEIKLELPFNGTYHGERKPRPVVQLTLQGEFVKEFPTALEGGLSVGCTHGGQVITCCRGKKPTCKGYKWIYAHEYYEKMEQGIIISTNIPYKVKKPQPVVQLTKQGEFIKEFPTAVEGAKSVGGKHSGSGVLDCCRGRSLTYKGYKWMFTDEYYEKKEQGVIEEVVYVKNSRPVVQLTLQGEFIKEFPSAVAGSLSLGRRDGTNVSACCKGKKPTYLGYIWLYADEYYENIK